MPVYAIQAGEGGPVKVGFSLNVENRVRQLQPRTSAPLRVLHVWAGGRELERALHQALAEHHVKDEWFQPIPALLDGAIAQSAAVLSMPSPSPISPLRLWREGQGLTVDAAARGLNVKQATVSRWEIGRREPDFAAMAAIEDFTKGAVTPASWVAWWRSCQKASA